MLEQHGWENIVLLSTYRSGMNVSRREKKSAVCTVALPDPSFLATIRKPTAGRRVGAVDVTCAGRVTGHRTREVAWCHCPVLDSTGAAPSWPSARPALRNTCGPREGSGTCGNCSEAAFCNCSAHNVVRGIWPMGLTRRRPQEPRRWKSHRCLEQASQAVCGEGPVRHEPVLLSNTIN